MYCPSCSSDETGIFRTTKIKGKVIRDHLCRLCGCEFETVAMVSIITKPGNCICARNSTSSHCPPPQNGHDPAQTAQA